MRMKMIEVHKKKAIKCGNFFVVQSTGQSIQNTRQTHQNEMHLFVRMNILPNQFHNGCLRVCLPKSYLSCELVFVAVEKCYDIFC